MTKRKLDFDQNEIEPLSKKLKLDPLLSNKRIYLTKDKKSWIDKFELPKDMRISKEDQDKLWELHPKELGSVKIYGKEMQTQRYHQSYGKSYNFSGKIHEAIPFPEIIQRYLDYVNSLKEYNSKFNMCLVNWYENGSHYIGYHSDDEKEIVKDNEGGCIVFSISFGQTRWFYLKDKESNDVKKIELSHCSVIVMGGTTQKTHKHSIPKIGGNKAKNMGRRINLTFRCFK